MGPKPNRREIRASRFLIADREERPTERATGTLSPESGDGFNNRERDGLVNGHWGGSSG